MGTNEQSSEIWEEFATGLQPFLRPNDSKILDKLHHSYIQIASTSVRECRKLFKNTLIRIQETTHKVYIILGDLYSEIRQKKRKDMVCKIATDGNTSVNNGNASKDVNITNCRKKVVDDGELPSTSSAGKPIQRNKVTQAEDESGQSKEISNKKTDGYIKKLDKLMKNTSAKIRELEEGELTLEELDGEDTSYLQLNKYQLHYLKLYKLFCKVKKLSRHTGRLTEKKFHYQGTTYPSVNSRIEDLVNKNRIFPDYQDIIRVMREENRKANFGLSKNAINYEARNIFVQVASQLKKRRQMDLKEDFGCHITDTIRDVDDPSLYDPTLRKKLEMNEKVGQKRLDEELEKHTRLQEESLDRHVGLNAVNEDNNHEYVHKSEEKATTAINESFELKDIDSPSFQPKVLLMPVQVNDCSLIPVAEKVSSTSEYTEQRPNEPSPSVVTKTSSTDSTSLAVKECASIVPMQLENKAKRRVEFTTSDWLSPCKKTKYDSKKQPSGAGGNHLSLNKIKERKKVFHRTPVVISYRTLAPGLADGTKTNNTALCPSKETNVTPGENSTVATSAHQRLTTSLSSITSNSKITESTKPTSKCAQLVPATPSEGEKESVASNNVKKPSPSNLVSLVSRRESFVPVITITDSDSDDSDTERL